MAKESQCQHGVKSLIVMERTAASVFAQPIGRSLASLGDSSAVQVRSDYRGTWQALSQCANFLNARITKRQDARRG